MRLIDQLVWAVAGASRHNGYGASIVFQNLLQHPALVSAGLSAICSAPPTVRQQPGTGASPARGETQKLQSWLGEHQPCKTDIR